MSTKPEKPQFILKVKGQEITLNGYQSPRGLRIGANRPDKLHIKMDNELNQKDLGHHIKYLVELFHAMEYEK